MVQLANYTVDFCTMKREIRAIRDPFDRLSILNEHEAGNKTDVMRDELAADESYMAKVRPDSSTSRYSCADLIEDERSVIEYSQSSLEWLSINWRNDRNGKLAGCKCHSIIVMADMNYEFFPTLQEILDGIIQAQNN